MAKTSDEGGPALPWLLSAVSLLLLAQPGLAAGIYGTDATLTGTRSVDGGGLTGFNDYATGFTVEWVADFDQTTPGKWHYKYTFTGLDGSGQERGVSHFVLDLSDTCFDPFDSGCVTDAKLTVGTEVIPLMSGATVLSTCGMEDDPQPCVEFGDFDGLTDAVKFDEEGGEGLMYEFDSNRHPVWGHFAVKDGGGPGVCPNPGDATAVCNDGLFDPDSMDPIDFVARPNAIPEPATLMLVSAGLFLLVRARRLWPRS